MLPREAADWHDRRDGANGARPFNICGYLIDGTRLLRRDQHQPAYLRHPQDPRDVPLVTDKRGWSVCPLGGGRQLLLSHTTDWKLVKGRYVCPGKVPVKLGRISATHNLAAWDGRQFLLDPQHVWELRKDGTVERSRISPSRWNSTSTLTWWLAQALVPLLARVHFCKAHGTGGMPYGLPMFLDVHDTFACPRCRRDRCFGEGYASCV